MTKLLLASAVLAVSVSSSWAQQPSLRDAPAILGSPAKPLSGSTSGSTRYGDSVRRGSREPGFNSVPNRTVRRPPPVIYDSKGRPR